MENQPLKDSNTLGDQDQDTGFHIESPLGDQDNSNVSNRSNTGCRPIQAPQKAFAGNESHENYSRQSFMNSKSVNKVNENNYYGYSEIQGFTEDKPAFNDADPTKKIKSHAASKESNILQSLPNKKTSFRPTIVFRKRFKPVPCHFIENTTRFAASDDRVELCDSHVLKTADSANSVKSISPPTEPAEHERLNYSIVRAIKFEPNTAPECVLDPKLKFPQFSVKDLCLLSVRKPRPRNSCLLAHATRSRLLSAYSQRENSLERDKWPESPTNFNHTSPDFHKECDKEESDKAVEDKSLTEISNFENNEVHENGANEQVFHSSPDIETDDTNRSGSVLSQSQEEEIANALLEVVNEVETVENHNEVYRPSDYNTDRDSDGVVHEVETGGNDNKANHTDKWILGARDDGGEVHEVEAVENDNRARQEDDSIPEAMDDDDGDQMSEELSGNSRASILCNAKLLQTQLNSYWEHLHSHQHKDQDPKSTLFDDIISIEIEQKSQKRARFPKFVDPESCDDMLVHVHQLLPFIPTCGCDDNVAPTQYKIKVYSFLVTRKGVKCVKIRTVQAQTPVYNKFTEGTLQHQFEFHEPASCDNSAKFSDIASDPPGQQSVYIPPGDVRKEAYRLSTFDNFPRNVTVSIVQLAKKGFHYTGYIDRVKCYSCGRTVEKWEPSDSADDNRHHKPDCLMAQGRATDNVPIGGFMSRRVNSGTDAAMFSRMTQNASTSSSNIGDRLPAGGTAQVRPGGSVNISANGGVSTLNGPLRNAAASTGTPRQWRLANIISSDHRRYLTNLHLNREIDRLATFSRWPITRPNVAPVDVARAGFFYLGDMDRTQCFSCGGVLRNWTREDNAMEEHRTHFATCRFVLGTDNRNVPVPILPETQAQMTANYPCQHPTNPHMRSEQTRFATFDSRWPSVRTRATPEQIAEAGFFYLGERDRVKCWYCNGGLQNWEYDDIPWVEHAKWFPSCQFLLKSKGQHFVYRHLSVSPHLPRPVIGRQVGATIDPIEAGQQRGQDIPPQISRARAPTPPPMIIDPQEQMRLRKQEVDKEIRENFGVRLVIDMGFDEEVVRKVLEERLEYLMSAEDQMDHIRTRIFDNTEQLLNAVQEREAEIKRELAEEREATRLKEIQQSSTRLRDVPEPMSVNFPSVSSNYSEMQMTSHETVPSMASQASGVHNVSGFPMDSDEEGDIYGSVPQGATAAAVSTTVPTSMSPIPNFGMDIPEDPASLQDMIERKKEEGQCKICFTEAANMVFMPCSHMCCCKNCTEAIKYCPVCRKKIDRAIIVYLE